MADVIVVTPNPAVDVTYDVDRQLVGETVRVRRVVRRAGGKGLNVTRVLHTLGFDVVAVQPLGGASGAWIAEQLQSDGIAFVGIDVPGETRTTVTVTDVHTHPTVLTENGPAVPHDAWTRLGDVVEKYCRRGSVVVISGSLPVGSPVSLVGDLVERARMAGASTVVDVSGEGLIAAARARADVLTPNAGEVMAATGAVDLDAGCDILRSLGARQLVVSRGARGLVAVDADGTRTVQDAVRDIVGNPTGAGDAATAGLVAARILGMPHGVVLRWSALLGAAAVLRPVAGEVDLDDIRELAARTPALDEDQRQYSFPPVPSGHGPVTRTSPHPFGEHSEDVSP